MSDDSGEGAPTPRDRVVGVINAAEKKARGAGGGSMRLKEEVINGMAALLEEMSAEAAELVQRANSAVVSVTEAAYDDAIFACENLPKDVAQKAVDRVTQAKNEALQGANR